jgi:hypothetical protein
MTQECSRTCAQPYDEARLHRREGVFEKTNTRSHQRSILQPIANRSEVAFSIVEEWPRIGEETFVGFDP